MPLLDVSLETANKLYAWGWKGSIAGAAITLVAVFILMLGTRVRDRENESQISRANLEAARANERAATLELEAASLKLQLQERTRPLVARRVLSTQAESIKNALMGKEVDLGIVFYGSDSEVDQFAMGLIQAFKAAGARVGVMKGSTPPYGGSATVSAGLNITGPQGAGLDAVANALNKAGIPFGRNASTPFGRSREEILLIVGQRESISD